MNIESIPFDDESMATRLIAATAKDLQINHDQALEIVRIMRHGSGRERTTSKHPTAFMAATVTKFSDVSKIDRAPIALQFFINLQQSRHIHSPIADNIVAIAFGYKSFNRLIKDIKAEFCDPHSSNQSEIDKCENTWGIPTPAQFLFGRAYSGVTAVTGGSTKDVKRLIAQEITLVEPKGIRTAIFTDSVLPYTLETSATPDHLSSLPSNNDAPFVFFKTSVAAKVSKAIDTFTAVIWDSPSPVPKSITDNRPNTLVIITENVTNLQYIQPSYLVVTQPNKITENQLLEMYPALKETKRNYYAQRYLGDAIIHITHRSGAPQRTIGYPWFPEQTKDKYQNQKPGLMSRIFSGSRPS